MSVIVARVDSPEGVSAAVQNGADAVIAAPASLMGRGLTTEEFRGAAEFCRVRGVELYLDLDRDFRDSEYEAALASAGSAWLNGADGIVCGSIGFIYALCREVPDAPVHGGLNLRIHDKDGLRMAKAMGLTRVYLAPELSRDDIAALCEDSPLELGVLAHGFNCAAYQGLCRFGPPGLCGKKCLTDFDCGVRQGAPLSLKDICLAPHVGEVSNMGVTALMVSGLDRRPEYTAILTGLYVRAAATGRLPTEDELNLLSELCSTSGITDGYYSGSALNMTAPVSTAGGDDASPLLSAIRRSYLRREFQRVPVRFTGSVSIGQPLRLTAEDDRGNTVSGEGGQGELAFHREFTHTMLQTELYKTGGTPFYCDGVLCDVARGMTMDTQDIAGLRDRLLSELLEKRKYLEPRTLGKYVPEAQVRNTGELPVLTVYVERASQLSQRLCDLRPPVLYIPLEEVTMGEKALEPFIAAEGVSVCAVLPRVIFPSQQARVAGMLISARQMGIEEVSCSSPGHVFFARQMGFKVRGGFGFGTVSAHDLWAYRGFKLLSCEISPDLSPAEAAALSKHIPCEYTVYGRTPVMHTETCVVKNAAGVCGCEGSFYLTDTQGFTLPVSRAWPCRSTVYSSKKLFMARRSREYLNAGLWGVRLNFTTEGAEECAQIAERYLGLNEYEPAGSL